MVRVASLMGLGLASCALWGTAMAEEGGAKPEAREIPAKVVEKFDKDGDGKLNDAERGEAKKAFAERRPEGKRPEGARPEGKRPEGQGEGAARFAELQKKFDKNGDGKLDATEREAARKAMASERPEGKRPTGEGSKRPGAEGDRRAEILKRFDKNGDGKLDENERQAAKRAAGIGREGAGRPGRKPEGR